MVRSLEEGDPFYASSNAVMAALHGMYASVGSAARQLEANAGLITSYGRAPQQAVAQAVRQACLCFQGLTFSPNTLSDPSYDDVAQLHYIDTEVRGPIPGFVSFFRVLPLWVHRDMAGACREVRGAIQRRAFFYNPGVSTTTFALLVVLCYTGQGQRGYERPTRSVLRQAMARLRSVAISASPRGQGMHWLACAELAAARGADQEGATAYERAISCAMACSNTFLLAVALECAGRFYATRGLTRVALFYLAQGRDVYRSWGGVVKVRLLEEEFAALRAGQPSLNVLGAANRDRAHGTAALNELSGRLDAMALIRASRALSEEVVVDKLVANILSHVMESAGATRAALATERHGEFRVVADSQGDGVPPPADVVQYVARSLQPVVIDDTATDSTFRLQRGGGATRAMSVLCTPMLHQGKLKGVLYLENNIIPGAFTAERLLIVDVLAAQAAVAIANARLYEGLEEAVAERTQQLSEAHAQLLRLERASTEVQMAGGFAHEMRNALTPAAYL
ncbi:MAG TPA: GAF domain-containing protein, partial [Myxococcota bacterium]|nr:GAF domain-containing protein [Myxococcota bacterium]